MYDPFLSALVLTVALAMLPLAFWLYMTLMRRAIFTVIEIFREHNALHAYNARTLKELGLMPRHFLDPFKPGLRDYKPQALQALIMDDIVQVTDNQRLYLCEEKLRALMRQAERVK